jgi:hypothetical protein
VRRRRFTLSSSPSSSSLNNAQNSRCCFFSLCSCKEKEKSNAWAHIRTREKCASKMFCVIFKRGSDVYRRSRTGRSRDRSTKPHERIHIKRVASDERGFCWSQSGCLREERVRAIDFYVRAEAVKQKRRHCGKSKKRGKNHHLFARMRIRIHLDDDETRNNNNVLEDV